MTTEQIKSAVDAFKKLKETGVYLCSYCDKWNHCRAVRKQFSPLGIPCEHDIDFCSDFKEAENADTN